MFTARDEGALSGLADLIAVPPGTQLDDQMVAQYTRVLTDSDLPLAATMSIAGNLRALIERVFYRTLVRELPEENRSLPWFECHVPPGGSTIVSSAETDESSGDLELKVFGSGLGRGRKTSISISKMSAPRTTCATYSLDLRVKPRLYQLRGVESVEVEIVACRGESVVSVEKCPYCGVSPGTVDQFAFGFGEHLDLRKDRVPTKVKHKLVVEVSRSIDAGLQLSGIPVELKLAAQVSRGLTLESESEFPPGVRYQPYSRRGPGPLQNVMWATEKAV